MKRKFFFLLFFAISFVLRSQVTTNPLYQGTERDSLIARLDSIESFVNFLKQENHNNKKTLSSELEKQRNEIINKQIESVKICAIYTERFAQGTLAMDAILGAITSNVMLSEMSSPFVAPTFKKNYDGWVGRWGKFLPAVIIPSLTLMTNNPDTRVAGVSLGIGLTALISGFSQTSDTKRNNDYSNALTNLTTTIELFDFNRMVYDDLGKLKAVIASVEAADSSFSTEYISYWEENKKILKMLDEDLKNSPDFKKYIENSTVYFDRFQLKLARVNYVLDFAYGMIESYEQRYRYVEGLDVETYPIFSETKKAIDDLKAQYTSFKDRWSTLQGKFYKLTPSETRKLNSFYQLEELLQNLK